MASRTGNSRQDWPDRRPELRPACAEVAERDVAAACTTNGKIDAFATDFRVLEQQIAELNDLKQEMRAARLKPQDRDQLVAQCEGGPFRLP
jgi:hypothetical protein